MNKGLFLSIGFVCVGLSTPAFSKPTIVEQGGVGSCGTGCSWVFYDDGRLEVIGTGENAQAGRTVGGEASSQPWGKYKDIVTDIEVHGITYIPAGAFRRMASVERINIDESTTSIGYSALSTYSHASIFIPDSVTTFSADIPGRGDIFTSQATAIYCSTNNINLCKKYIYKVEGNPINVQEYTKNPDGSYDLLENGRAVERYASLKDFQNSNVLEKYGYDKDGNQYLLSSDGKLFLKQSDGSTYYFNENGKLDDFQGKRIYTVDEATFMAQKGDKNKFVIKYR